MSLQSFVESLGTHLFIWKIEGRGRGGRTLYATQVCFLLYFLAHLHIYVNLTSHFSIHISLVKSSISVVMRLAESDRNSISPAHTLKGDLLAHVTRRVQMSSGHQVWFHQPPNCFSIICLVRPSFLGWQHTQANSKVTIASPSFSV